MTFERLAFLADDGFPLELRRAVSAQASGRDPIILVHGAGVRANIFNPPVRTTLIDMLLEADFDVWLLDWRASIEHKPNHWNLDQAAVFDYPAAVRTIVEHTGASSIKAVIHCQGSTSFMMSIVAGLLPQVSTVVSNAVALYPIVPERSWIKSKYVVSSVGKFLPFLNPQWGYSVPDGWPKVIDFVVRATHHECNNPVCKHSSFTFGSSFPTLWRHENLDDLVHEWLKGEFGPVPMTFFNQMRSCIAAGHLVSTGQYSQLPENFVGQAPKTDARFVFLGGELNECFRSVSQAKTFDFFDNFSPGRHAFYELAGYGHLDVFIGAHAACDVFPLIIQELRKS